MIKKIIVAIVVIGISAAVYGMYLFNKPTENVVVSDAELTITATALIEKFDNEPNLSTSLLNKVIEVKGTVTLLEKGEVSSIFVLNEKVKCEVINDQLDDSIKVDSQVTLKGVYNGIDDMFNEIILAKCQLIK